MRGGVHWYAAQAIQQIDTDSAVVAKKATMAKSAIAEKGHFWMQTSYNVDRDGRGYEDKSSWENFMYDERPGNGLEIVVCRDSEELTHVFASREADIYLSAIERHQFTGEVAERLGIASAGVVSVVNGFERKGLNFLHYDIYDFRQPSFDFRG